MDCVLLLPLLFVNSSYLNKDIVIKTGLEVGETPGIGMKSPFLIVERQICPYSMVKIYFLAVVLVRGQHDLVIIHVTRIEIDLAASANSQLFLDLKSLCLYMGKIRGKY